MSEDDPLAHGDSRLRAPRRAHLHEGAALGLLAARGAGNKSRTRSKKTGKKKRGRRARRSGSLFGKFALEIGVFGLTVLLAFAGIIAFYASDLPATDSLWRPDRAPHYSILASDGSPLTVQGSQYGAPVRLSQLPRHVTHAVLAVEDRNFYHHIGFNPLSVGRAILVNTGSGAVRQGGSTITQQLAKNLFLSSERTIKRKVQELLLAFWLEQKFSKEEILTLYLNRVYLGAGAYGIDAASYRYFGKSAKDLTLNEAALIAGLLKAPSRYNPTHNPTDAGLRAQTVIESMQVAEFISPQEAINAIQTPIYLKPQKYTASNYFVDHILARVRTLFPDNDADLIIQTSFDPQIQRAAESGLQKAEHAGFFPGDGAGENPVETAIVISDGSGAVRAMIGGRNYARSQFNRATQARRQPGSAFKPFIYLAALEAGAHPENIILDAPISIGDWSPSNYKKEYYGEVTLAQALAKSMNSATIRLQEWAGRPNVLAQARKMGIEGKLNPDPALALGVDAISPLKLAQGWTPLANGGLRVQTHAILSINTAEGDEIYRHQNRIYEVAASPYSIANLNMMLRGVTEWGTGKNARVPGRAVAGKTGTTQASRDAWFAGHMDGLVAVVWTGRDNYSPMKNITGGRLPAKLWGQVMGEVALTLPAPIAPPPFIVAAPLDQNRGAQPAHPITYSAYDDPAFTSRPALIGGGYQGQGQVQGQVQGQWQAQGQWQEQEHSQILQTPNDQQQNFQPQQDLTELIERASGPQSTPTISPPL